jgi:2-iminobutanoate/2-iminopropanoate deaminase
MINFVQTDKAPAPAGHYSQATEFNNLIFVSGQLAIDPATGEKKLGTIEEQTLQTLENVKAIVEAAGGSLESILKMTLYVSDISLWGRVNEVYTQFFGAHKPARAVVPTRELHYGFLIEIEAIAAKL